MTVLKPNKIMIPDWEQLSALRTTSILKIGYFGMAFVPIIAIAIVVIRSYFDTFPISLSKPLFLTYLASILLSIAHFLNETLCPFVIKKYGSAEEYKRAIAELIKNETVIKKENALVGESLIQEELESDTLQLSHEQKSAFAKAIRIVVDSAVNTGQPAERIVPVSVIDAKWQSSIDEKKGIRSAILGLYATSAAIGLLLTFRQSWIVFSATFLGS